MPVLQYTITGDNSSLVNATQGAIGAIEKLTSSVNGANASLQFNKGVAALDKLGQQLLIAQGNVALFGDSVKLQTQQLSAYQTALNTLLAQGFEPMDGDVQALKQHIDELNASIAATPKRTTISVQGDSTPADSLPTSATGATAQQSEFITALNEQLANGTITATEYNQALLSANSTAALLGQTTQQTSETIVEQDGYLQGLKQALAELNEQRITAPAEDLAILNGEIQETEIAIQQATNVGKQGFDEFGNSIRGVSVQSINGQLVSLSNNLFGARQIARDLARSFTSDSLAGAAKNFSLLAVDFLFYAQNAAFATGATTTATAAIGTEGVVASGAAFSIEALGAAFASLLTPLNLVVLGVALTAGGFLAYERSQKSATEAAKDHAKAVQQQKQALDELIGSLSEQAQAEAKAADTYGEQVAKLSTLYTAIQQQITAGKDYTQSLADLQTEFPVFFGNLDTATVKTQALSNAFQDAVKSFQSLGIVAATQSLSTPEYSNIAKSTVAQQSIAPQLAQLKAQLAAANAANQNTPTSTGNSATGGGIVSSDLNYAAQLQKQYDDLKEKSDEYGLSIEQSKIKLQQLAAVGAQNQQIADGISQKYQGLISGLENQLAVLQKQEPYLKTQAQIESNIAQQKAIQAQLDELEEKNAATRANTQNAQLEITKEINSLLTDSSNALAKSGLTGYAKQVADISAQYETLDTRLAGVNEKIAQQALLYQKTGGKSGISGQQAASDFSQTGALSDQLKIGEAKQLSDAQIAEAQRVSDTITQINNEFGVKADQSQQAEIARVTATADKEINLQTDKSQTLAQINANYQANLVAAGDNVQKQIDANNIYTAQIQQAKDASTIIVQIKQDQITAINAINEKYLLQEQDLEEKIVTLNQQSTDELSQAYDSETARINKTYADRLATVNSYYQKLRTLQKTGDPITDAVNGAITTASQATTDTTLDKAHQAAIQLAISKPLIDGIGTAASNFYSTLTAINQQTDHDFKTIFSNLATSLETSLNSIFLNVVEKGLESALKAAISGGTSDLFNKNGSLTGTGAAIAAGGLLGGVISGSTSKTSEVGQGLGGALSGAATGAVIGSVIPGLGTVAGGIIGGAVGLLGGILGASKAQKALQEQQLEQQQEQTALLKASLAYTSSIIGRDTANGILTDITVGATGQLVATVSGKDLQFILNRNANTR